MRRLGVLAWLSVLLASIVSAPAFADKRVALVIGNSAYRNVGRLDNPANDAKLLSDTLRALGFTLVGGGAQLDLDKPAFDRTVQAFGAQLAGADVGLFYYAGHGVQVRGENYLIPVDANPTKEADVDFQMLDTNLVLRQMEGAGTRLNIVILDACRNNPFGGRSLAVGRARDAENDRMRDTGGGLAQMQAPEGTLISFATQPGSVAQDGADGNSPYARALADTIRKPGLGIFDAFNQIGLQVKRATRACSSPGCRALRSTAPSISCRRAAAVSAPVRRPDPPPMRSRGATSRAPPTCGALRQFADEFPARQPQERSRSPHRRVGAGGGAGRAPAHGRLDAARDGRPGAGRAGRPAGAGAGAGAQAQGQLQGMRGMPRHGHDAGGLLHHGVARERAAAGPR